MGEFAQGAGGPGVDLEVGRGVRGGGNRRKVVEPGLLVLKLGCVGLFFLFFLLLIGFGARRVMGGRGER